MSNFTEAMAHDNEPHRCTQEGACYCNDPKPELTQEQLKNLGKNMSRAAQMAHFYFEVEEMKRLEPDDKKEIINELAKTLTDEQMRDLILSLQKALSNR